MDNREQNPEVKAQKRSVKNRAFILIASLFYTGYIPLAPGTFGALIGLIFLMSFKIEGFVFYSFLLFIFIIGVYVSDKAEQALGERDSRHIVIDEFAGYMVSMAGISQGLQNLLVAFIFFRVFDILKPFPIRNAERILNGGLAIMVDDVIAGIYSNIALRILFLHNFS